MNAQYFTEITLGEPPQTVRHFNSILCSLTNPVLVQSHSRHWVRTTSSFPRVLADFALVQVIFGFQVRSAPPLPASSIPSMTLALPRHTNQMVPNSRFSMAPDPWKASSLTICCRSEIFLSKDKISQRPSRNQALLLLSGSASVYLSEEIYTRIDTLSGSMAFLV